MLHWVYLHQFDSYQGFLFDLCSVYEVSSHRRWHNFLRRGSCTHVLHGCKIDELVNKRLVSVLQQEISKPVRCDFGRFRHIHQIEIPHDEFHLQLFPYVVQLSRDLFFSPGLAPTTLGFSKPLIWKLFGALLLLTIFFLLSAIDHAIWASLISISDPACCLLLDHDVSWGVS